MMSFDKWLIIVSFIACVVMAYFCVTTARCVEVDENDTVDSIENKVFSNLDSKGKEGEVESSLQDTN